MGGRPPKLQGREAEIVAAYEAGATVGELKMRFGVSNQPIRRILDGAGVTRPKGRPTKLTAEQEAEVVALYQSDARRWTIGALARRFPAERPAIRRVLNAAGIEIDSTPGKRSRD